MATLKTILPQIWTGFGFRISHPRRRVRPAPLPPEPDPPQGDPHSIRMLRWDNYDEVWRSDVGQLAIPMGYQVLLKAEVRDVDGNVLSGYSPFISWTIRDAGSFTLSTSGDTATLVTTSEGSGKRFSVRLIREGHPMLSQEQRPSVVAPPLPPVGDGWFVEHADHAAPTTQVQVPASINATGAQDVSAEMQDFIGSVPDNRVIVFPAGATYRCERTLQFVERNDLLVEGNGAILWASVAEPTDSASYNRNRANIDILRCNRFWVRNLRVKGANVNGGTSTIAQVTALEAQHSFNIRGGENVIVEGCEMWEMYGDGVYIRSGAKKVKIRGNWIHHNGRQGLAIAGAEDVLVDGNLIEEIRRGILDIEPPSGGSHLYRLRFSNNIIGSSRLQFLPSQGGASYIEYIDVRDNTFKDGGYLRVTVRTPVYHIGYLRNHWRFINNITPTKKADNRAVVINRVADFHFEDNKQHGSPSRGTYFIEGQGCRITAVNNDVTGFIGLMNVEEPSVGCN
jgi:hypothetical protein